MAKSSRARTRERKRERERKRQRNRQIAIVGAIVVVALIVGVLFVLANLPAEAPLPPGGLRDYGNLIQGATTDGYPILGNPDAPVEVVEYSSFSCSGCLGFHDSVFPALLPRIERGEISFTYIPLATGSIPNPTGANKAALCAADQGMFWEMHDLLFYWHGFLGNTAFQGNRLIAAAEALSLNLDTFNRCVDSQRIDDVLASARQEGVTSTPSIYIDQVQVQTSLDEINATIDFNLGQRDYEPGTIDGTLPGEEPPDEAAPDTIEEATEAVDESAAPESEATEEADMTESSDESEVEESSDDSVESSAEATDEGAEDESD